MDLETINIVITVARLKSFSATALSVPCSQSSVSRKVDAAESELGVKIFDRPSFGGNKVLELTPAGEEIVKSMVKVVDAFTELYRVADLALGETTELLNLGIVANMMPPQGFARMKSDFFDSCPDITLSVKTGTLQELIAQFRMRSVDAVLFTCMKLIPDEFETDSGEVLELLGSTAMSVGIAEDSPLAAEDRISLASLKDTPFLLNMDEPRAVSGVRRVGHANLQKNCRSAGFEPTIVAIPGDMLEIRYEKAKKGRGVFPSHTPQAWRDVYGIKYLQLIDLDSPSYYYLLRAEGRKDDALESFSAFFRQHME